MSVYHPDENVTPKNPPSSDSAICTWPSCGHTAKGQCRGAARRIQLFTDDQLAAAVADAVARAVWAEAALAVAEEALLFYADKAAWTQPPIRVLEGEFGPAYENEASQMRRDIGKLARSALAKIAALKGGAA